MGETIVPPPDSLVESLVESFAESLSVSDSVAELLSDSDSLTDSEDSTLELSVLEDPEVAPLPLTPQAAIVKQARSARSKMLIFLFIRLLLHYSSKSPAS